MRSFPAFIDVKTRDVVIIGGGENALRKARLIVRAGGAPTLIWQTIDAALRDELGDAVQYVEAIPHSDDFERVALVFIAIDDDEEAVRWAQLAKDKGALVNVVDQPAHCDFTTPSIIDRGALTIAISTDGAGPVFARQIREKVEALTPARSGALLDLVEPYRDTVKSVIPADDRRAFWEEIFNGPVATRALAGDMDGAKEAMMSALNGERSAREGVVHIVGAGPGDPELLTLKALRLLQAADVILYDRLVSDEILDMARRDAERVYVGKAKSNHAVPQSEIAERLIAYARQGKTVVRLKGGDPFVFGRGGEELDALRAAGIKSFVTPGITAATGCAAAAGMALTHRDYSQAVTFVTGHAKTNELPDLDWPSLSALKNTLVVYMGVGKAPEIAENLIKHGREGQTPVAVIENGTRDNQIVARGVLASLATVIEDAGIKGPAILVIGEVAALAQTETLIDLASERRVA